VEHLLSALAISGVDACDIYVTGPEIPLLDGAALEFLDGIQGVGLESMPFGGREAFRLSHPVWVDEGERTLVALPAESFRVSCVISFPHTAIGSQTCSFALDEEIYRKEIAPARTFCLEEDIARLRACGLALGGDYASVLVYGKDGPVGTESKYDDECVRHKALDLIGDISLLGSPLAAHVIGYKFGHALSVALVRRIAEICTLPQQSGEQQSGKGGV
jgi:UDP-3-O-[3-hydroxymyristoyl] N-acetylglucosamine deacetylase